jgi:rRNA methylase
LVFGNEQSGLTIEQQEKCNRLVTIPGNPEYFSLNLAQAVQIMCYEIYSQYNPNLEHLINPVQKIDQRDVQHLLENLQTTLTAVEFDKHKNMKRVMRRLQKIIHKADLEREEADLLHGMLKKVRQKLT